MTRNQFGNLCMISGIILFLMSINSVLPNYDWDFAVRYDHGNLVERVIIKAPTREEAVEKFKLWRINHD